MQIIDTSKMSRAEWLALRRQSIGASDTGKIAGLIPSRLGLFFDKTGEPSDDEPNEFMWWGSRLESPMVDYLVDRGDFNGHRQQVMIRNDHNQWMTATLDVLTDDGKVWELKAARIGTAKRLENDNPSTLPDHWVLQAHHQMMCADVREVRFGVFIGHRLQLYRFTVEWDDAIGERLVQLESEFWRHVQENTPPAEFDPVDAAVLLRHFKGDTGVEVFNENPRMLVLAKQYEIAKATADASDDFANQIKAAILMEMGDAPAMRFGQYLCKRQLINVKGDPAPKPRPASSYVRFSMTNSENNDE